jgi:hypothetical protein
MDEEKPGYKRPPKATQFKPGTSGNPRGRPKKPRDLEDDLIEMLSKNITVREDGKLRKISRQKAILRKLLSQALQGDAKALSSILSMRMKFDATREAPEQRAEEISDSDEVILDDYVRRRLEDMKAKENEQSSPGSGDRGLSE